MTIGMSVTVSETDVPISAVRPTGSTSASPSARRSRRSWVSSLRAWAMMRRMGQPSGGDDALLGDDEEDVLQRVVLFSRLPHPDALARQPGREVARGRRRVAIDDDVEAIAEERDTPRLQLGLQHGYRALRVVGEHLEHAAALRGLHAARRALGHQLAGDHESQPVALLGFLEIVRGDEDRGALVGKLVDHGPERAAGDRVDARRRLVEEQHARLVHDRRTEGHALLPAAGQAARELAALAGKAGELEHPPLARLAPLARHLVDAREEVEVLVDREVVVERELLRHVADLLPDTLGAQLPGLARQPR